MFGDLNPTLIDVIYGLVLLLLGGSTGYGVRGSRGDALTERLATIQGQLTDAVNTLDGLVKGDLVQLRNKATAHENAITRHDEDVEGLFDALTIYMTHKGEGLPEAAREAIMSKLDRKRRRGLPRA